MTAPRIDAVAATLLDDGGADVRTRTTAARVYWRRELIGRPPTRAEERRLRAAFDRRRAVIAELARRYRA